MGHNYGNDMRLLHYTLFCYVLGYVSVCILRMVAEHKLSPVFVNT